MSPDPWARLELAAWDAAVAAFYRSRECWDVCPAYQARFELATRLGRILGKEVPRG